MFSFKEDLEENQSSCLAEMQELSGYIQNNFKEKSATNLSSQHPCVNESSIPKPSESHSSDKDPQSLEEKRRKSRIRSKNARVRKKEYIEHLEGKVKRLEKENFRLQSLILGYRRDTWENVEETSTTLMKEIDDIKKDIFGTFVDLETMEAKEKPTKSLKQHFEEESDAVLKKHQHFLDKLFEIIINHLYPIEKFSYWKDLGRDYKTTFENIKKFEKMSKYQKQEYINEKEFNKVDEFIMSLSPNKRQFTFLKEVVLKKEYELKQDFMKGIELLIQAKNSISKTNSDLY